MLIVFQQIQYDFFHLEMCNVDVKYSHSSTITHLWDHNPITEGIASFFLFSYLFCVENHVAVPFVIGHFLLHVFGTLLLVFHISTDVSFLLSECASYN